MLWWPFRALLLVAAIEARATAGPLVSPVFGSHMVLQRGRARIWGWAAAGTAVRIMWDRQRVTAVAGADGRWLAALPTPGVGGPHSLAVEGGGERVALEDVLVGDVWLCSGQSNMALPLRLTDHAAAEAARATLPKLRLLAVKDRVAYA